MRTILLALPLLALGCSGGGGYVPVSGVVTLDDKPLANVMVTFQPLAVSGDNTSAGGVGSFAMTDANGRYTLEASTATPTSGAYVGKHRVRIATPPPKGSSVSDSAMNNGVAPFLDPIPKRYNIESTLDYEVPSGGTKEADFKLTSNQ